MRREITIKVVMRNMGSDNYTNQNEANQTTAKCTRHSYIFVSLFFLDGNLISPAKRQILVEKQLTEVTDHKFGRQYVLALAHAKDTGQEVRL